MSLRSVNRAPAKRMLVFFQADSSTSILSTSKVKKIVGGGNKLEDGVVVIVDFDNVDYEALVIKLHDDPTVLSQHEDDFVMAQQFGKDDVHDNPADKENNQRSKRVKLTTKEARKEVNSRKQKDKPKAKPKAQIKKIITIEAEVTSLEHLNPSSESTLMQEKEKNKPGCLKFLDPLEQVRVQRLLDNFTKGEGKEMSTQTEQLAPSMGPCVDNGHVQITFDEKWVQTETEVSVLSCHCKAVVESLKLLHEKVDNLTAIGVPIELQPSTDFEDFNNDGSEVVSDGTSPLPSMLPILPSQLRTSTPTSALEVEQLQPQRTSMSMTRVALEFQQQPHSISTPNIRNALFEETFRESSSIGNFAKNLVFKLFARHELEGTNCVGVKGKTSLEKDQRMEIVKEATFKKYSVEDRKKSWGLCRKAIDCAIRHLRPLQ